MKEASPSRQPVRGDGRVLERETALDHCGASGEEKEVEVNAAGCVW